MGSLSAHSPAKHRQPSSSQDGRRQLILVVGSEPDTRFMLKAMLEIWDYDVAESSGAEETIKTAQKTTPDMIVMDTTFPFAESLSAIKAIRGSKDLARIPLIVLSGYAHPQFRKAAFDLGVAEFFVKPVDFDFLENYLRGLLGTGADKKVKKNRVDESN